MAKAKAITCEMIDELVAVREQLRSLTAREKKLKEAFADEGAGIYASDNYQIEIRFTTRSTLDLDAARAALGAEFVAAHQKSSTAMNIVVMELVK